MKNLEFGTKEYFDSFRDSPKVFWGFNYRASQQLRYNAYFRILEQFSGNYGPVLYLVTARGVHCNFAIRCCDCKKIEFQVRGLLLSKYDLDATNEQSCINRERFFRYNQQNPSKRHCFAMVCFFLRQVRSIEIK